jgi:FkbM family methyltransferase
MVMDMGSLLGRNRRGVGAKLPPRQVDANPDRVSRESTKDTDLTFSLLAVGRAAASWHDVQPEGAAAPEAGPTVLVDGAYGPFEGLRDDAVILGEYQRTGRWASEVVELLGGLLAAGGTLLDVGANLGLVCIPVLQRAPAARCLALEPAPANFALLGRNVARHGLGARIECLPLAAHDTDAPLWLALSQHNHGDHRVTSDGASATPAAGVPVRGARLDTLVRERALPRPLVMKIDTQGAERRVLEGARGVLPEVEHVVLEYWPAGLRRAGDTVEALHALFGELPYGEVLGLGRSLAELTPVAGLVEALSWVASHRGDEGFFDVLLSRQRRPVLPAALRG